MTSYPKVNGIHVDSSNMFIQDILRDQWKFDGLVMSDWGATTSTKDSIKAGLDLEMPGPAKWRSLDAVKTAVETGSVTSKTIAKRARAVLQLPISWPWKYEDTAVCGNFGSDSYDSREVEYVEGVYVGYRHFDKHFATER
jgi:beta-glucosidase-like glycosyl hydrolase